MKKTLSLIALTGVIFASAFPALAQDAPQVAAEKAPPLVITEITSLISLPPVIPAAGNGQGQACAFEYYYDAAHTQWSGNCYGACYAGGNYCQGVVTEYSVILWCEKCTCGFNGENC